jgi:hypothetical protein
LFWASDEVLDYNGGKHMVEQNANLMARKQKRKKRMGSHSPFQRHTSKILETSH